MESDGEENETGTFFGGGVFFQEKEDPSPEPPPQESRFLGGEGKADTPWIRFV